MPRDTDSATAAKHTSQGRICWLLFDCKNSLRHVH